jgi:hypothetical protein
VDVSGAERQERTITTEIEVPTSGYNVEITGIYAVNNQLWSFLVSPKRIPMHLKATMRVSDRVVLNAPEMPIRHYVIGERPQGSFNQQYTFIDDRQAIASQLESDDPSINNLSQSLNHGILYESLLLFLYRPGCIFTSGNRPSILD